MQRPRHASCRVPIFLIVLVGAASAAAQTFVDVTSGPLGGTGNALSLAWGDYDGDGDPDLYVVNGVGSNSLLRNDGGGVFVDVTSGPLADAGPGRGCAWGDYDNDGDLDLYVVNYAAANKLLRNDGGGVFADATNGPLGDANNGQGAAWGDYDGDGDLDIYLGNSGQANKLFRNEGAGVFVDASSAPVNDAGNAQGVSWADYDNDGDLDIYLGKQGTNQLFRNDGGGVFVDASVGPLATGGTTVGMAWGDYDNDGDLDVYMTNNNTPNKLLRNDGAGIFVDVTSGALGDAGFGRSTVWGDYDNDGDLDLYLVNRNGGLNKMFRNDGGGVLVESTPSPLDGTGNGYGAAWADYDGDGDIDLYVTNSSPSTNLLYRNDTVTSNHWLRVNVRGVSADYSSIGARVRLVSGGISQIREISGGAGLYTQDEPVAAFGLGTATSVDSLFVRWPNGRVRTLTSIAALDTTITVEEPKIDFADVTSGDLNGLGNVYAVGWSDYDLDGDLDLYLASPGKLLQNDGGVFSDVTVAPLDSPVGADDVLFGDYDGDGDEDLFVVANPCRLFRNDSGSFVEIPLPAMNGPGQPLAATWLDCDVDGDLDLYVVRFNGTNRLLVNAGGTFIDATVPPLDDPLSGRAVVAGDIDSDGDADLYVGNFNGPNRLFENKGGTWIDETPPALAIGDNSTDVALGDMDGDGDLDLYVANELAPDRLFSNDGSGNFTEVVSSVINQPGTDPLGVSWVDVDNDGDLDLYVPGFSDGSVGSRLLVNDGSGNFKLSTQGLLSQPTTTAYGAAWGDYDGDGALDVYLLGSNNQLLRNANTFGNHWLTINPLGTNSPATGVVVRVQADGKTWTREVGRSAGNMANLANFGLGGETLLDLVEITWPSGIVQSVLPVPAVDQQFSVTESEDLMLDASAGLYEDRVVLRWTSAPGSGYSYRVERDGVLLSLLASGETTYTDLGADPDVNYEYCVKRLNTGGEVIGMACDLGWGSIFEPSAVAASDSTFIDGVRVEWNDRSNVEIGYNIYRSDYPVGTPALIGTVGTDIEFYDDLTAVAGVVYEYCVAAENAAGFESDLPPSAPADVCDTGSRGFILPPLNVSATDGQFVDRVRISWGDGSADELGFRIYRRDLAGGISTLLATLPADSTSFDDLLGAGADFGVDFEYCVVSYRNMASLRATGASKAAKMVEAESSRVCDPGVGGPLSMLAPEAVSASDSAYDDKIVVTWTYAGKAQDGFQILRDGELLESVGATALKYIDATAFVDSVYSYCVVATSDLGGSSDPALACDTGVRSAVVSPSNVAASDGSSEDSVTITWASESTTAVMFGIYRDGALIKTIAGNLRTAVDDNVDSSNHDYCVRGITALGAVSTPGATACDTGHRTVLSAADVAATDNAFENKVRITWRDQSTVEAGYRIYRADVDSLGLGELIGSTASNRTTFEDLTAVSRQSYRYGVVAFDHRGGESAVTNDVGVRSLRAPSQVEATDAEFEDKVVITWRDESNAEKSYAILRRVASTTGAPQNLPGSPIIPAGTESFEDLNGELGESYEYFVLAVDDFGTSAVDTTFVLDASDVGSTALLPPASVNASDEYSDRRVISWVPQSAYADHYVLERDGIVLAASIPPGTTTYVDSDTGSGSVHEYCVKAVSLLGQESASACDIGALLGLDPPSAAYVSTVVPSPVVVGAANERFGRSLGISEGKLLVGAPVEDANFSGAEGSVRTYTQSANGSWTPGATLTVSNPASMIALGTDLSISGNYAIVSGGDQVGSKYGGNVVFFEYDPTAKSWSQKTAVSKSSTWFGIGLDMDGDRAVVPDNAYAWGGGPTGRVYTYSRNPDGSWGNEQTLTHTGTAATFGSDCAMDGTRLAVGNLFDADATSLAGAVYIFELSAAGQWQQVQKIYSPAPASLNRFGERVALDGEWLAVGEPSADRDGQDNSGYVHLFHLDADTHQWVFRQTITQSDAPTVVNENFGLYGLELVGNRLSASVPIRGRSYVFGLGDTGWSEILELSASDGNLSNFGSEIAMSQATLVVAQTERVSLTDTTAEMTTGRLFVTQSLGAPEQLRVVANATVDDPVGLRWNDTFQSESGYKVFRDGELLETLPSETTSYYDFSNPPGNTAEYEVSVVTTFGETAPAADYATRPADGAIAGRVVTKTGAGVPGVSVCLEPNTNNGLQLDGSGGHARIPNALMPSTAVTVEMWLRTAASSSAATIYSYVSPSGSKFTLKNPTSLQVVINNDTLNTSLSVADGQWHHLAVSYRSSDRAVAVYVDGAPAFAATAATGGVLATNGVAAMGAALWSDGTSGPANFSGILDELRVWSSVRAQSQIEETRSVRLTGSESGLLGYWAMDQSADPAVADLTNNGRHAKLIGGANWTVGADAVNSCGVTDLEGNYVIPQLRYSSTTFKVVPSSPNRRFEPAFKSIVLSSGNPVQNEVGFTENTSFTISGTIKYQSQSFDCFPAGVDIYVDNVLRGKADSDGNYQLALEYGNYVLEPRLEGHTFDPAFLEVAVTQNAAGLDFQDKTLRRLTGKVAGGCDFPIGQLDFLLLSENGCVEQRFSASSEFVLALPPERYFIVVEDVSGAPAALDEAEIFDFFRRVGTQEVDLSAADVQLDFIYRAPLRIEVSGLPAIAANCVSNGGFDLPGGGKSAAAAVMAQGDTAELTIQVVEDYGNGNLCPAADGVVQVFDDVLDRADEAVSLVIENGLAMISTSDGRQPYATAANTPSVFVGTEDEDGNDRSYQKFIFFRAEVEGQEPVTARQWVLVTGNRPRASTFTTVAKEIPLLILRDPPGDASYSYLEEGTTFCTTWSGAKLRTESSGEEFEVNVGLQYEFGIGGVSTEFDLNVTRGGFEITGDVDSYNDQISICATTTEVFSTSDDDAIVGAGGDVYMGVGMNFDFAKTDVVELDGCTIRSRVEAAVGPSGIDTAYLYTENFIKETLIPQWQAQLASDPTDVEATAALRAWESHLELNERLKDEAVAVDNRSFNAGAEFRFTSSSDSTTTVEWSTTIFSTEGTSTGLGLENQGIGGSNLWSTNLDFKLTTGGGRENTIRRTVGYALSDDDVGDFFEVQVKNDPQYGTPVFAVDRGTSSCPWEPWPDQLGAAQMQPRDRADLSVDGPSSQIDVPSTQPAVFTVFLRNDSPSGESRDYVLLPIQTSNPYGAVLRLNGDAFSGGQTFRLLPQQTQEVTLTVERGPLRYQYDDLKFILTPACMFDARVRNSLDLESDALTDSMLISVHFDAPCTDIVMQVPQPGWFHNLNTQAANGDTITVRAKDFLLELSETKRLQQVRAEYRRQGTPNWISIGSVDADDIATNPITGQPKSVEFAWNVAGVPDGVYDIRTVAVCESGSAYSNVSTGRIDLTPPTALEVQPADQVLSLGDVISIQFNESIDCTKASASNVAITNLTSGGVIDKNVVCASADGRLVITSLNPPLSTLEDDTLQVIVSGVPDLVGNPSQAAVWQFVVEQSAFAWATKIVSREVDFGASSFKVDLVNGSLADEYFDVQGVGGVPLPAWLSVSPATGLIRAQEALPVEFGLDFSDPLDIGSNFQVSLEALMKDGGGIVLSTSTISLNLDLVCAPPSFAFTPAAYQHSMTLTAELSIEGQPTTDPNDKLVAYVGNQIRGVGSPELVNGLWRVFLTIYGKLPSGESMRFEIWDDDNCRRYPGSNPPTLTFLADDQVGSVSNPQLIEARDLPNIDGLTIPMAAGWNWFSLNLISDDMTVPTILGSLNPSQDDIVKAQFGEFAQFSENVGWVGTLDEFDNVSSYALHISDQGSILVQGDPVFPSTTPIPIGAGWNWIGYTPAGGQALAAALANLQSNGDLSDGDLLKDRQAFAEYESGPGWLGSLLSMEPGTGYKLYLSSPLNGSFTYPQVAEPVLVAGSDDLGLEALLLEERVRGRFAVTEKGTSVDSESEQAEKGYGGSPWNFNPRAFEYSMTITARVQLESGQDLGAGHVVGAFVNGELRGVTRPVWVAGLQDYRVFLMAFARKQAGDELRFAVYDPASEEILEATEQVLFAAESIAGGVEDPVELVALAPDTLELPTSFSLRNSYPNPFHPANGATIIRYALPRVEHVTIEIFDVRGRLVQVLVDERRPAGRHELSFDGRDLASGIYLYRMQAGDFDQVKKLTVLK